jgi:hypothetical protein
MISEFQDLSDKISRLAELADSLRRENTKLRVLNKTLAEENVAYTQRLSEAQRRVEGLLAHLPLAEGEGEPDQAEATQ